jgi:hypothetical protein
VDRSRCRVAAHDRSLHVGFAVVHQKTIGLLGWASKARPEARWAETGSGHAEKLRCWRSRGGIAGLASGGVTVRWRGVLHDLFALERLYHNLSARGSVVICMARRGLIYISSRVSRKTIHLDCFPFPCSIGLDSSSVCKESDLRVNGSFHGCVDLPLVARWIFVSFSSYFHQFFMCDLSLRFLGVWVSICWWESWIVTSCIFVLDLDPPNSKFGLRLEDFGWTLGFWLSSVSIQFPAI